MPCAGRQGKVYRVNSYICRKYQIIYRYSVATFHTDHTIITTHTHRTRFYNIYWLVECRLLWYIRRRPQWRVVAFLLFLSLCLFYVHLIEWCIPIAETHTPNHFKYLFFAYKGKCINIISPVCCVLALRCCTMHDDAHVWNHDKLNMNGIVSSFVSCAVCTLAQ